MYQTPSLLNGELLTTTELASSLFISIPVIAPNTEPGSAAAGRPPESTREVPKHSTTGDRQGPGTEDPRPAREIGTSLTPSQDASLLCTSQRDVRRFRCDARDFSSSLSVPSAGRFVGPATATQSGLRSHRSLVWCKPCGFHQPGREVCPRRRPQRSDHCSDAHPFSPDTLRSIIPIGCHT